MDSKGTEQLHALVTGCFAELDQILQDTITRLAALRGRVPRDLEHPVLFEMGPKGFTAHKGHWPNGDCTANCTTTPGIAVVPHNEARCTGSPKLCTCPCPVCVENCVRNISRPSTGENLGGAIGYDYG